MTDEQGLIRLQMAVELQTMLLSNLDRRLKSLTERVEKLEKGKRVYEN